MAEVKATSTAELNAEAMKRMDAAKPVPSQEDLDKHLSESGERAGMNKTDEQRKAEEQAKQDRDKDVVEANKRMNESTPTPTQAEVDQFVVDAAKRQGGERSDEQKKAGEQDKEERTKRNAEANKRMEESRPTPTQAEIDTHVASLTAVPAHNDDKKEKVAEPAPGASYQTRAARAVPREPEPPKPAA